MRAAHRQREIDCSSAIVGGPAAGAESGGKSIHWTCMWRQKVLHSGCCGWRHNYYHQQRQADRANEQSTSLRWCGCIAAAEIGYSLFFTCTLCRSCMFQMQREWISLNIFFICKLQNAWPNLLDNWAMNLHLFLLMNSMVWLLFIAFS